MFYLLYKHQWNTKPFHLNSFWSERCSLLWSHSNGDIFTCEDNMLFSHEDIKFLRKSSLGNSLVFTYTIKRHFNCTVCAGWAKTYVWLSGTFNPLTWLVRGTSTFLIRKNRETVENCFQITVFLNVIKAFKPHTWQNNWQRFYNTDQLAYQRWKQWNLINKVSLLIIQVCLIECFHH